MFGIKSRGEKNFNGCQVRSDVSIVPHPFPYGIWNSIQGAIDGMRAQQDGAIIFPRVATFNCPRLGEYAQTVNDSVEGAKATVAHTVGKTSCRGCVCAHMTPADAEVRLQQLTYMKKAQTELAKATRLALEEQIAREAFYDGGPVPPQHM